MRATGPSGVRFRVGPPGVLPTDPCQRPGPRPGWRLCRGPGPRAARCRPRPVMGQALSTALMTPRSRGLQPGGRRPLAPVAAPGSLWQGTARHDQCSFDPSPWRPCLVHADNLPLTSSESESRPDHSSPGLYVTPAPPQSSLPRCSAWRLRAAASSATESRLSGATGKRRMQLPLLSAEYHQVGH